MLSTRLLVMVVFVFFLFGGSAHAKDNFYELSLSTLYNPGQTQFKDVFEAFAEEVEKRTDGSILINVFGVGTIVAPLEEGHAVKSGNIDMGPLISQNYSEIPYSSILQLLPDLSQTIADTVRIGHTLYSLPEVKKETDFYGKPLGFTSVMPQIIISNNELIKTPADLKGKRMLVMSGTHAIQAAAWGAIPVMVSVADVYIGMQRGMGEVILNGISFVKGTKLYETAKYMTMLNYPNTIYMPIIINKELFAGLSENQQNILVETAEEYFGEVWQKSWEDDYNEALMIFKEAGCEIYYPTEEESLLWQEANKGTIPEALKRAEDSGITRKGALEFLDRTYDVLEADGFEVNRYTGS